MSINTICVSGNLVRDAELRSTAGGAAVLAFRMAVNTRRRNARGEWEDAPNYVDCAVFGKRAQALASRLPKGVKVCVSGGIRWREWDKDGERRSAISVAVEEIEIMSGAAAKGPDAATAGGFAALGVAPSAVAEDAPTVYDEDIPF